MEPVNELERKLAQAAREPAFRPEFYRALLEAEIFVIGSSDLPGEGRATLPDGTKLAIETWKKADGTAVIPFFTSVEAMKLAIKDEPRFMVMAARKFFELTLGARLVINPASAAAKEFAPQEVKTLLEAGTNVVPANIVVRQDTRVQLGQPAVPPDGMMSALATLLSRHASVKAAYVCQMLDAASDRNPMLLVGLEGEGDLNATIDEIGSVALDTAPEQYGAVNIIALKRGEPGVGEYMLRSVTPFYTRSVGGRLKSLFGRGKA